jgi:hypothetical protein
MLPTGILLDQIGALITRLPHRRAGLGLCCAEDHIHAAYLSSISAASTAFTTDACFAPLRWTPATALLLTHHLLVHTRALVALLNGGPVTKAAPWQYERLTAQLAHWDGHTPLRQKDLSTLIDLNLVQRLFDLLANRERQFRIDATRTLNAYTFSEAEMAYTQHVLTMLPVGPHRLVASFTPTAPPSPLLLPPGYLCLPWLLERK